MGIRLSCTTVALFGCLVSVTLGQSPSACKTTLTPTNGIKTTVASGYQAALVATGLTNPRNMRFDNAGNLLVVQQNTSIVALQLQDNGGACISVKSKKTVIDASASDPSLDGGIALSQDRKTLYASTVDAVYSWSYDPASSTANQTNTTVISDTPTPDNPSRTLLMSHKANGILLVGRGSDSDIDPLAQTEFQGHSQIKAFNLTNITSQGYEYEVDGLVLGWGLRNPLGIAEHPVTGGVYSTDNSLDKAVRDTDDISDHNPGEELNFHGYLNGQQYPPQGSNYGYPFCYTAWDVSEIPQSNDLQIGSQFSIVPENYNSSYNDTYCSQHTTAPRLTFEPHSMPSGLTFNVSGNDAWIAFHGSNVGSAPSGYKVSLINFGNGEPLAQADNNTSYTDILTNADNSACPKNCFSPAGLAFDRQGRLFVNSDTSGEIYVIVQEGTKKGSSGGKSSAASLTVELGTLLVAVLTIYVLL